MLITFFRFTNTDNNEDINSIISILREIESVTAVFNIDLNIIKDKNLQYLIQ